MKYPPHKPRHYNVAEAKAQFSTLVRRALQGEEIIVAKDNTPLVKIVPIGVVDRKPGSAKGQIRMARDFDATPADFDDYL
ncbi:MAG: type II toxin-antitoxin system prevent-host-death family antitoxin [Acidobacteria bacterium]|nr:MAG: type II toxin-antitoxin system prevent-host-death family antitoxin [Acidobacteriota bacterium]